MSHEPAHAIRAAIEKRGPIPFSEFMTLALYGPGGFYEEPPIGPRGDFVTSPHVHPVFGMFVGRAIRRFAKDLGDPLPIRIAEVGAGDGTLARQVLEELSDLDVAYTAVEISPGARECLSALPGIRVTDRLDEPAHVVVANELLDNLPFRRIRGDREIRVGLDGDRFVEVDAPWVGEHGPPGVETIVPDGIGAFLASLAEVLDPGYALLIDYGGIGSTGGDVHGYSAQDIVDDPITHPGTADITVGVDFAWLSETAHGLGLLTFGPLTQREALISLGFEEWSRARARTPGEPPQRTQGHRSRQDLERPEPSIPARRSGGSRPTPMADDRGCRHPGPWTERLVCIRLVDSRGSAATRD